MNDKVTISIYDAKYYTINALKTSPNGGVGEIYGFPANAVGVIVVNPEKLYKAYLKSKKIAFEEIHPFIL